MNKKTLQTLAEVAAYKAAPEGRLFSATHEEITTGLTTDIYFIRTRELLRHMGLERTPVTVEVFAGRPGILAGVAEVKNLLGGLPVEAWALPEGAEFKEKDVVMRISGAYDDFGIYETALLGILASSSGWATAARRCREAAGDKRVVCFGARHVHPAVAPVMERAAILGGADGASCILGAKLAGQEPSGTVPHAVMLIVGDTVQVARVYQQIMPPDAPVIILVDTFKDEAEESLRVAEALGEKLQGVRLDTPSERGGVTPGLVREVKARLCQAGFPQVKILVSGGITPERIPLLIEAGADAFGVGSYISGAPAIDMTMDIKEVNGSPVAKRGRIPGLTRTAGLEKIL
ncbi:nicotinate phosphoribosyltransferase [Desulfallas sp. Bu1-1]|jgi:nicotinate phosphoribosyltransferase|uniref:nicotinate phosphoribosyltransferase n=1 Tax=Desulfallas sp. Bu1-1 TaxID=2787620 RepID=UPI00189DBDB8|nr:nicotinate phosphoribosyltransferase [Desulfallas sp. Bu1-1]MBF7082357.1 nicotinate phosphoribosyltransferase [Desulfallas sp. Bu1-1]